MATNDNKNIEKATDETIAQAASTGHITGSKKTVDAATKEMLRRTTF